jgi:hypothetical protein
VTVVAGAIVVVVAGRVVVVVVDVVVEVLVAVVAVRFLGSAASSDPYPVSRATPANTTPPASSASAAPTATATVPRDHRPRSVGTSSWSPASAIRREPYSS